MLKIYRGLDKSGKSVVFIDGEPSDLCLKTAEEYSGNQMGEPANDTVATLIGKVGWSVTPVVDNQDVVVSAMDVGTNESIISKLNAEIARRGIRVIDGSAETHQVRVCKVDDAGEKVETEEEERTVLSVVLEPNDGEDGNPLSPDTQGDIYSAEAIRNTAWGWMEKGGKIGLMHELDITGKVAVIESYVALADFDIETTDGKTYKIRKGTWILRLRIYDDLLWQKAKDGTLGAFSVGGVAEVEDLEQAEGVA